MYELTRAIHILAMLGWVSGLLIMPRLLIYRLDAAPETKFGQMMDRAALRLQKIILTPSLLLSWLSGIALMAMRFGHDLPAWLWLKLVAVLVLTGLHGLFAGWRRRIADGQIPVSPRNLRLINEAPFLLAAIIVLCVVLEPAF